MSGSGMAGIAIFGLLMVTGLVLLVVVGVRVLFGGVRRDRGTGS